MFEIKKTNNQKYPNIFLHPDDPQNPQIDSGGQIRHCLYQVSICMYIPGSLNHH